MKNIIFDLGGVVLDWNPEKVRREFTTNPELPRFLFDSGFFQEHWTEFDRGTYTEEEMTGKMSALSGFPLPDCREFMEYIKHSLVDIPRTVGLIRNLSEQGYPLYYLSNMSHEFYDYLKGREVFRYFKGQIISAREGMVKPDEAIFHLLLERFGLEPHECLFVDDLPANVKTAADLGFHTALFADREKGYQAIDRFIAG